MIGPDGPLVAQLVSVDSKEEREDGEEESRHLQPQDTASVCEGFPHRFAEFARSLRDGLAASGVHLR